MSSVPPASAVPGLQYIQDFITPAQHDTLLQQIDGQPWLTELRRRVQHYGFKYDYRGRAVDESMRLGPLPDWALEIVRLVKERNLTPDTPDQVIVNEYEPGQGIAPHVDCVPCFTATVLSLSLGSAAVMEFTNKASRDVVPLLVEPRSLLVMSGAARYDWRHGIVARKTDEYGGRRIVRGRRVSVTLRKVILRGQPG